MIELAEFAAVLSRDKSQFLMQRGRWRSGWTPIGQLPDWIRIYRGLRDRRDHPPHQGPYHEIYAPAVAALEAIQAKLKETKSDQP